ncbi:glucose 1-dehydrogenase [Thalassobaculum sp. OXR-137]|uniref:SDR family NAD(P)-dependent oxidoreductase n=1 Tax=Thalassobaculum sp. OXR-137 TaxID=3100173 RepID=UPI002AC97A33|nr:glucose 1-dehydrogenase [Thalassobaculum sp. OXR-137]WPZ34477.1 glucose 1-dehydrogenase [Thalassobaculum sp. OXR-137]
MANRFDLTGKTALVTGASQGLGAGFAKTLAEAGAKVALAARQTGKLEALKAEIEAAGGTAAAVAMDVTDPGSVSAAFDATEAELGVVDILVNNAGIAVTKPFLEVTVEDWDSVLDTNLKGCFLAGQEAARRMAARHGEGGDGGSIINIASVLGQSVIGHLSGYCTSKAALIQLTKSMALELARVGVRVNALAPGYIETPINTEFFHTPAGEKLVKGIPQRQLGQSEDLDGGLLLLASDASKYMTGTVVTVDGGFLVA